MSNGIVVRPQRSDARLDAVSQRQPSSEPGFAPSRLPSLDGFRAISILMVLSAHAAYSLQTSHVFYLGSLGVRCFFVISGFIITFLLLKEETETGKISLRLFYARRFLRIVPVYLLFIACVAVLDTSTSLHLSVCNFVTALTYTMDFGCGQWVDAHLWSLSVEEQFYLLWPILLVSTGGKSRIAIAIALICLCPVVRIGYHLGGLQSSFSPFTNADALMFGCVGALLLEQYQSMVLAVLKIYTTGGRLVALGFIVFPIFIEVHFWLPFLTVPFAWTLEDLGLAYLILSYTFVASGVGYWFLNLTPTRFIGIISYSLYIWQEPFFSHPDEYGLASSRLLLFPLNVVAIFVVASVSYYGFERPLFGLRRRLRPVNVMKARRSA